MHFSDTSERAIRVECGILPLLITLDLPGFPPPKKQKISPQPVLDSAHLSDSRLNTQWDLHPLHCPDTTPDAGLHPGAPLLEQTSGGG